MNWANRLTLSRLALTVLFVLLLSSSWHYARTAALVIFLIAGLTDFIDGEIARRYGVVTNFGKLMDPLVDKIMVAAAFISLVPLKAVPAWAATTVVARDFLITGLRMMASAKGRILPAESLGKQKTSWQIVTIVFFLALLSIAELHYVNETSPLWLRAWDQAGPVLVWVTVALTLYSGVGYAWRNRELLGEKEPIEVEILRYSLKEKGETTYITIEEATSSREWLTAALREFVVGQDLPIPAKAGAVLKLLT